MLKCNRWDAYQLMHDGILAFHNAEQFGMRIDVEYCNTQVDLLEGSIEEERSLFLKSKIGRHWSHKYGKRLNLGSDAQLRNILFSGGKIKPISYTKGDLPSVDQQTLQALNIPGMDHLIRMRRYLKTKDTYFAGFLREQVDGVLHPFYDLHTAVTYRSSSSHINFHNIPKRDKEMMNMTRRAILPRPGHQLLECDYSGIEVRVAACYHKDPVMLNYINDPTADMHKDMAMQLYKLKRLNKKHVGESTLRQGAKNGFVFPQFYGDYYVSCAPNLTRWARDVVLEDGTSMESHLQSVGLGTPHQFETHVKRVERDFWYKRFKKYQQWKEEWLAAYKSCGYIDMYTGFRCSGVFRKNEVINYPIQGSAFHCLLWTFIQLDRILREDGWDSRIVGQIHDAMVFDVLPQERDDLLRLIHRVGTVDLRAYWDWLIVPMELESEICPVDCPWSEKEFIEFPTVV